MKTFLSRYLVFVVCLLAALIVCFTPAQASVPQQTDLIVHGKYIATIAGCTDCHTNLSAPYLVDPTKLTLPQIQTIAFNGKDTVDTTKFMAGGRLFDLGPAGKVYSANLTPDVDTGIGGWTDEQIKVAVRTGQIPSGRMLVPVMPYHTFNSMAETDLDAVVAYLRSIPAIKNKVPAPTFVTDNLQPLPYTQGKAAPGAGDKNARGEYLVKSITSCTDCHTPLDPASGEPMLDKYLAGGQPYVGPWGTVYGGNITPDKETGIGSWTQSEIKVALLTGVNNKGRRLILMPWFVYSALTNDDADAVAYYIKNSLLAVRNDVPAAALNKDFNVSAPVAAQPTPSMPMIYATAGGIILVLVIVVVILFTQRKRPAS